MNTNRAQSWWLDSPKRVSGIPGPIQAFACSARRGATCRYLALAVHSLSLVVTRDTSWRTRDTSCHFLSFLPESVAVVTESARL